MEGGTTKAMNEFWGKNKTSEIKKNVQSLKNRMNRSEDCISKMEGKVGNLPKETEKKIQTENTNRRPAGHLH